jgi:hypothetical protein
LHLSPQPRLDQPLTPAMPEPARRQGTHIIPFPIWRCTYTTCGDNGGSAPSPASCRGDGRWRSVGFSIQRRALRIEQSIAAGETGCDKAKLLIRRFRWILIWGTWPLLPISDHGFLRKMGAKGHGCALLRAPARDRYRRQPGRWRDVTDGGLRNCGAR